MYTAYSLMSVKERKKHIMALKKNSESVKLSVNVKRAKEFPSGDVGFDVEINGVTIYGCIYKQTEKGSFVSFPAKKSEKDGKYYNHVYVKIDENTLKDIEEQLSSLL